MKRKYPPLKPKDWKIKAMAFIADRRSPLEREWLAKNGGKPIVRTRNDKFTKGI